VRFASETDAVDPRYARSVADPDAPHRTIQIDALTDVQLIDDALERAEGHAAPPPLPRPPRTSRGRAIGLTMLAVVLGVAFALGVVRFLFPAPPPASVAPVRQIQLDELVIHAGQ